MKNMTDIDVLAVTMLEPEAVSIEYRYLAFQSYISTYLFCVFFLFFIKWLRVSG